jgi:hypothetical protein
MYVRYRHRRGVYQEDRERGIPRPVKTLIALAVLLFLLYWIVSWILGLLGFGSSVVESPATLFSEDRGIVSVSLQGDESVPAENGMSIFTGDAISTGSASHASLTFSDGTWARLDEKSEVDVIHSAKGEELSEVKLKLTQGTMWALVPSDAHVDSIHSIEAPNFSVDLPARAEVVINGKSLIVFSADGAGVTVHMKGKNDFTIGEGQQWIMPDNGQIADNIYVHRSAIKPETLQLPFVQQSRSIAQVRTDGGQAAETNDDVTIVSPGENTLLKPGTVKVQGTVSKSVAKVLLNGYSTPVNTVAGTFSQEISVPAGQKQFNLQVKALNAEGETVDIITRSYAVEAQITTISSPSITSPAKTGETYRTNAAELVIRGTSPKDAAAMMVNDYRLQLFSPEKGTWSYLAGINLGNLKPGTNVFDVYAIDASGQKSSPARLTIVWGEAETGTVTTGNVSSGASSAAPNPASLPTNAPLAAGSLTVTGPTAGTSHTETGTGFLLEGKTSKDTASIWVNDYMLQLYRPGVTFWNYIASAEFGNLKRGKNVYTITARNAKWEILDTLEYTVEFKPE